MWSLELSWSAIVLITSYHILPVHPYADRASLRKLLLAELIFDNSISVLFCEKRNFNIFLW